MTDQSEIELQGRADALVQREVHLCLSSMVATLAGGTAGDTKRTFSNAALFELADQAVELSAPVLDYEEAAREAGCIQEPGRWMFETEEGEHVHYATAESACAGLGVDPHDREVYEHWAVSQWLGEALSAAGERVDTDFAGLNVWARTTTGQAISMDAVIRDITRELHAG